MSSPTGFVNEFPATLSDVLQWMSRKPHRHRLNRKLWTNLEVVVSYLLVYELTLNPSCGIPPVSSQRRNKLFIYRGLFFLSNRLSSPYGTMKPSLSQKRTF